MVLPMGRLAAFVLLFLAMVAWPDADAASERPFYDELGLSFNATSEDIDAAYQQHAQTWSEEKKYAPAEIRKILEIEHAYHVLSNDLARRDYDYFAYDPLQADADRVRKHYEGRTEPVYVQFPLLVPKALSDRIESTAETITYSNYGDVVLNSQDTWVIQIYSVASPECHEFAPIWDKTVDLLEGVVRVGRLELGETPMALILAERNWLHGFRFFRNGLPAIIAIQPDCKGLNCIHRYYDEQKTADSIADWVATRILRLPRILYYSPQTLMSDIIQKTAIHKVKVIQFSTTGERAALHIRKAARDLWQYAVFAMVLWRESEATFWETRVGVEFGPATVILKDPGLPPVIHHGKLNSSEFHDLLEEHKTFELPQLRSITAADLGCDVSSPSVAGEETKIWYCVIVAGRPSLALNQARGVARGVQEQLTTAGFEGTSSSPGVKAFKDKRLSLVWLDGEMQKAFCFFYLNSETMVEACGPRKYEVEDIPQIFLIRYIRLDSEKESASPKKRWIPKSKWEMKADEDKKYAAQLVTKFNGSAADVSEIVDWISTMVTQGDNEDLPFFRGKSPDLVAEEGIPLASKAQDFVLDKTQRLREQKNSLGRLVQDLKEDSKLFTIVVVIAVLYTTACFLRARQKTSVQKEKEKEAKEKAEKEKADQVSSEGDASGAQKDVSPDGDAVQDSSVGEDASSERAPPTSSEGLRRREPFQGS